MFNLNISRKVDYSLTENNIDELISIYGIKCKFLFSEKINKDTVFRDFSHFKVNKDYKDIYLMPEDAENWEGDVTYNLFGPFNQWTQHLFISKKTIYELYPDFLETGRHNLVNSLIVTPSSTLLEITHVESFGVGINNLWGYADQPSSYKMTVKIYDHNIADQGTRDIKDTIQLEEKGQGTTIHEYNEPIDTSEIDKFFNTLDEFKTEIDNTSTENITGANDTNSPFGNLS
jgi:hypothetical protein